MEELVDVINQLQDVFLASGTQGVDLPQIVVVGTQSSGKSSVLEHIVGKSFLPRGTGIVTRCPIILQMVHAEGTPEADGYALFQHNTNKIFTDERLIAKEIEDATEKLAGKNKGICHHPIILKICSTSILNLTMVDLPGLTKVPVGDQPQDIEEQTRSLIMKYIENPNCIILAVTSANVDMANSESLKIAREVDPEGTRTLAVVTKLDLMDKGTNAWDMLNGKIIPVKLGIVGVVNRSQKDIQENKSIDQSLKNEEDFFQNHYKSIAHLHGCSYLQKTVQRILINHIKNCLPTLTEKIKEKLSSHRKELQEIGDLTMDGPTRLLSILTRFSIKFCSAIRGDTTNIRTDELYGGARIYNVFKESFASDLYSIDALKGVKDKEILTAIQNSTGAHPTLFVPEVAFELMVKKKMVELRAPCIKCLELVHEELRKIVKNCTNDKELEMQQYPTLKSHVNNTMMDLLQNHISITKERVEDIVSVQLAYINNAHPDFLPNKLHGLNCTLVGEQNHPQNPEEESDSISSPSVRINRIPFPNLNKAKRDCELIKELIKSYFFLVKKSVQDMIPKVIMHFLVISVMNQVHNELVCKLYKSDVSDVLLESTTITEKRNKLKTEISELENANKILTTFKPSNENIFKVVGRNANFPRHSPNLGCILS